MAFAPGMGGGGAGMLGMPMPGVAPSPTPDSDASKKPSTDVARAHMANVAKLSFCRSYVSIVAGVLAGVLGLIRLQGVYFFLLAHVLSALAANACTRGRPGDHFMRAAQTLWLDGMFDPSAMLSYLLFWTLAFGVVHIY